MKDVAPPRSSAIPLREQLMSPPIGGVEALASRPAGPFPPMRIKLVQLQRVASHMHSLDAKLDDRVQTRIRYLVRSGFPRRYDIVKGSTTMVDLGDALKIIVAFELLAFGMAVVTATASLNDGWDLVGKSLVSAWLRRSDARTPDQEDLLLIRGDAGGGEGDGQRVTFSTASFASFDLAKADALPTGSIMILDLHRLAIKLEQGFTEALVATPRQFESEMRLIAAEIDGGADAVIVSASAAVTSA